MVDYSGLGLPQDVLDLVQFSPMEDAALTILRAALPTVPIYSLIPEDHPQDTGGDPAEFYILVRRAYAWGEWGGDPRGFMDVGGVEVHVYTHDPDGDLKGALISEAVRSALEEAAQSKMRVDDHSTVHDIRMVIEPVRKADWATSQGPVQYADLPLAGWRYITTYQFKIRRQTRKQP